MKIGIITFHWATNYGAVLQAFALQQYLADQGHQVEIINYKPRRYDFMGLRSLILHPQRIIRQYKLWQRERLIARFRRTHLLMTRRYFSGSQLRELATKYDVVISGSDQVLNPSFTIGGEGHPTDAYYLGFADNQLLRIGYAVSFGCIQYPVDAHQYATRWIQNFDAIGYREFSGFSVLQKLQYAKNPVLVPDPTILYGKKLFDKLYLSESNPKEQICVYLLGNTKLNLSDGEFYYFIDECHKALSLEKWLSIIRDSKALITNSYHGMLMAILMHTPFVVVTKKQIGQNDRLATVLKKIGLSYRMVENDSTQIQSAVHAPISWDAVDAALTAYQQEGVQFIQSSLSYKK